MCLENFEVFQFFKYSLLYILRFFPGFDFVSRPIITGSNAMDPSKGEDDKPAESKETFSEVPLDLSVKVVDDNKASSCVVPKPESKQDQYDEISTPKKSSLPLDLTFTSSVLRSPPPPSSPLILTAPMFHPAQISGVSPPIIVVNQQSPMMQRPSTVIRSPIAAAPAPAFYMPFNPTARIANQYVAATSTPRNFAATSLPAQFSPVSSPNQFFAASIPSQFSTASLPSQFSAARQPSVHDAPPQLNFAPILSGNMLNYAQPFMFKTGHDPLYPKAADNAPPQPALPSAAQIHYQQHQLRQHEKEHIELQQQQMHQQQQLQQVQEFQAQLHKSVQQHLAAYGNNGIRWYQQYINGPVSSLPDFESRPFSIPERFVRPVDNYNYRYDIVTYA